jgi:hypothetical protein
MAAAAAAAAATATEIAKCRREPTAGAVSERRRSLRMSEPPKITEPGQRDTHSGLSLPAHHI